MNENSKVIFKNTSVLMMSQIITWIFSFLVTIIQPRYIGPAGTGEFSIAYAIWMILSSLITFGSDTFLVKEIARNPNKAGNLMGTVLVLRGINFLISCIGLAIYLYFVHYPLQTVLIIIIIGLSQPLGQMLGVSTAALRGIERMEYISLTEIIAKVIYFVLTFLAVTIDLGIYAIAAIPIIIAICSYLIQSRGTRKYIKIQFNFDRTQVRYVLQSSLPFVVSGLILTSYFQMDKLIMSTLLAANVMGWYSVSVNLFGTFLFLPTILSAALFPAFSRTYGDTNGAGSKLLGKSIDLMFLFGIPIGFGLTSISDSIVYLLYGPAFAPAATILSLMGFVLLLTYLTTVIGQYTVATDRVHAWTILMIGAVLITIPLDIWLIPLCAQLFGNGGIGGALTFLITEFGMAAVGLIMLPRGMLNWSNVRVALSTLAAGLGMMAACWLVRNQFILVPVIVGGLTYIGIILLLRTVPREDMNTILYAVRNVIDRIRKRQVKAPSTGEA